MVPTSRLAALRSAVTKLARRCAKLGMQKVELVEHKVTTRSAYRYDRARDKHIEFQLPCTWVSLGGASPVVAGYVFLARIEHTQAGNLVSRVSGDDDLSAYFDSKNDCAHCKLRIRTRKDTFVLRAPDGSLTQVGRTCLADYLRSAEVDVVLAMIALTEELTSMSDTDGEGDWDEDGGGWGGGWTRVVNVADFIAASVVAIRKFGWVPSQRPRSTRDMATFISGVAPKRADEYADWLALQPTEDDGKRAAEVLEWATTSTDATDYMQNLRVAIALDQVRGTTEGILASAAAVFGKEVERREAAKRALPNAGHFGKVKDKVSLEVTVERARALEGSYGVVTLIGMTDDVGHRFTWFASGEHEVEVGTRYKLTGTIKKHDDYKGAAQTLVTRCKLTKLQTPAASKAA